MDTVSRSYLRSVRTAATFRFERHVYTYVSLAFEVNIVIGMFRDPEKSDFYVQSHGVNFSKCSLCGDFEKTHQLR